MVRARASTDNRLLDGDEALTLQALVAVVANGSPPEHPVTAA
jgi:hypothetical protein